MKRFAILFALTLAGCAGRQAAPVSVPSVSVEVQKPCVAERPVRPSKIGPIASNDPFVIIAILAAKLAAYSDPGKYADRAEAIMNRCTVSPSQGK